MSRGTGHRSTGETFDLTNLPVNRCAQEAVHQEGMPGGSWELTTGQISSMTVSKAGSWLKDKTQEGGWPMTPPAANKRLHAGGTVNVSTHLLSVESQLSPGVSGLGLDVALLTVYFCSEQEHPQISIGPKYKMKTRGLQ